MRLDTKTLIALISCLTSIALGGFAIWQNSKIIQLEYRSQELSRDIISIERSPNIQQEHLIIRADTFSQLFSDSTPSALTEQLLLPRLVESTGLSDFIMVAETGTVPEKRSTFGLFLSIKNYSQTSAQNLVLLDKSNNEILIGSISPNERKLVLIGIEIRDPFSERSYYNLKSVSFEYQFNGEVHERSLAYIFPSKRAWTPYVGEMPQFGSATINDSNSPLMED